MAFIATTCNTDLDLQFLFLSIFLVTSAISFSGLFLISMKVKEGLLNYVDIAGYLCSRVLSFMCKCLLRLCTIYFSNCETK